MKPFAETKFGQFFNKVADKAGDSLPEIAGIAQLALTNPLAAIAKTGQLLFSKKEENPEILALHEEFEQQRRQFELDVFKAESEDRQRASNLYGGSSKDIADKVINDVFKKNHWMALGIVGLNALLILLSKYYVIDATIIVAAANLFGMLMRDLLQERRTILEYLFGASFSKEKPKDQ